MTHSQSTITNHYQQLQSYERGLIHAVNWMSKVPEFFRQLVIKLRRKPHVQNVDFFVHRFKMNQPELLCPSTPTVYRYIDRVS